MDNIYSTAKLGEIGIFLAVKISLEDLQAVLVLISELQNFIRQEERERARRIIEEVPIDIICEKENNCDCGDPLNCKWTKGHNYARGESEYWIKEWKQEALKKLNNET